MISPGEREFIEAFGTTRSGEWVYPPDAKTASERHEYRAQLRPMDRVARAMPDPSYVRLAARGGANRDSIIALVGVLLTGLTYGVAFLVVLFFAARVILDDTANEKSRQFAKLSVVVSGVIAVLLLLRWIL